MKYYILYSIVCITFYSCITENKDNRSKIGQFTLEPTHDTIYLELGKKQYNQILLNQYFTEKGKNYLAILDRKNQSIFIFDLDKQVLYKEIKVIDEGENSFPNFSSFAIKSLDSIIFISPLPKRIAIANSDGNILKQIPIEKDHKDKEIYLPTLLLGQRGIIKGNELFILQTLFTLKNDGILDQEQLQKFNIALRINLNNYKVESEPLDFPSDFLGKNIFSMHHGWELGYKNQFIFFFSILENLYKTQDFSELNKIPIITKQTLKLPINLYKNKDDFNAFLKEVMKSDLLSHINYDKYRECYYLIIRKRAEDISKIETTTFLEMPNCIILILDKDLHTIGEVELPDNTYSFNNLFITKEGLYISEDHINNPSFSEDVMRFRLFKLKKL